MNLTPQDYERILTAVEKPVSKGIYSQDGKKINLKRTG